MTTIQKWRLFEGGVYLKKYGTCSMKKPVIKEEVAAIYNLHEYETIIVVRED